MMPVLREDGRVEDFMPRVDGSCFRCSCTCNVFHKPDDTNLDLFQCNACGARYLAEGRKENSNG